MLVVHTPYPTSRTDYAFGAVFDSVLGVPWRYEADIAAFCAHLGPKLWYAEGPPPPGPCASVVPEGLLFERGLRKQVGPAHPETGTPEAFAGDVFAAAFWGLTRMEEYGDFAADEQGRFPAAASWAAREGLLHRPWLDWAVHTWWTQIRALFPQLPEARRALHVLPTYDIDYAWSYLHKGWARNAGGTLRDVLAGDWAAVGQRARVLMGRLPDPYHTFDWLDELHDRTGVRPTYFWHVGDHGPYDKNISPRHPAMRRLIERVAERYAIGLHPSHRSFEAPDRLADEKKRLEDITGQAVVRSRQHYLRFRFPETPRRLLEMGIAEDWTLGYAEQTGFRAGTAWPFPWYDLERETPTRLLLRPFHLMDVTFRTYLGLDPAAAKHGQTKLLNALSPLGGELVSIWHNNSFSEKKPWIGWREVYEDWLQRFEKP
jgi:hypothetical protein